MPLVSVVLIFLNEGRYLEEAVRSVVDQTLTDWELILVDDGSLDQSTQIALDFAAGDDRIFYFDHPNHQNRGMAASRNLGVAHSRAPFLAFIDGDDVWMPYKLAEQVQLLERMPDVAMVSGARYEWHSWDSTSSKSDTFALTCGVGDLRLDPPGGALIVNPIAPVSPPIGVDLMVRRSAFDAVGGFAECFPGLFEDQTLIVRILLRYPVFISSRVWLLYRQHADSTCAKASRRSFYRTRVLFFDWLEVEVQKIDNPLLAAAVGRARRQLGKKRAMIPVLVAVNFVLSYVSDERKTQFKRALPGMLRAWRQLSR